MNVPYPSWCLLDIRLEMVDRIPELGVPAASEICKTLEQRLRLTAEEIRQALLKFFKELHASAKESHVEQTHGKMNVIFLNAAALVYRSDRVTGRHRRVPKEP